MEKPNHTLTFFLARGQAGTFARKTSQPKFLYTCCGDCSHLKRNALVPLRIETVIIFSFPAEIEEQLALAKGLLFILSTQ